jgi:hypothetical protein
LRTKADRAPFLDAAIPNAAVLATVLDVERGTAVLATRDVGRAWRSLGAAILTRIRLALGAWLD